MQTRLKLGKRCQLDAMSWLGITKEIARSLRLLARLLAKMLA